jgi:hypothetical protein
MQTSELCSELQFIWSFWNIYRIFHPSCPECILGLVSTKTVCGIDAVCNVSYGDAPSCGFDAPEGVFHYSALLLSFGFQSSSSLCTWGGGGCRIDASAID